MSFPFDKHRLAFAQSSRMTTSVVGLSLAAVGLAIYLSPVAEHNHPTAAAQQNPGQRVVAPLAARSPKTSTAAKADKTPAAKAPVSQRPTASTPLPGLGGTTSARPVSPAAVRVLHAPGTTDVVVVKTPGKTRTLTDTKVITKTETTTAPPAKLRHCSDFRWQQDAQVAYLENLSDPGSLDGARGPNNGDGIACNELPVDPTRPVSDPVGAYQPPVVTGATKTALVSPTKKYFGVAQDGLPGDTSMFASVATQAGKAPSSVEWFSGFDQNYGANQVRASWARGALPVITWMSVAADPASGHDSSEYTLSKILSGSADDYLYQYAGDVVRTGLPVVIRFDHEMNGNWYSWSAGMYNNTPAKYVQAWQHVWNIFNQVGANNEVIWLWSPSRTDNLKPHAPSGGGVGQTTLAEDYPGDKYVDWMGASMYLRVAKTGPTYSATFGKTLADLKTVTTKPIFIPETGAIETDLTNGSDVAALKAAWIENAIGGFLADPAIVGFVWFNNAATAVVNGESVTNDWRFDSSAPALSAFKTGVGSADFAGGMMPDAS